MEATRQIYWNVDGSTIVVMYLLAALAMGILVWGLLRATAFLRLGKPVVRDDQFIQRLLYAKLQVFAQIRVRYERVAGVAHSLFFWGFVALTIGTILVFLQADVLQPLFHVTFLKGDFYRAFSLILDVAGALALLMILSLAGRRYFSEPRGLVRLPGDFWALFLLFWILVTGFWIEGLRIASTELQQNPDLAYWSPLGRVVALQLEQFSSQQLMQQHQAAWVIHMGLVMAWIGLIPFTRLKHLILVPLNIFFADLGPKGKLVTLNLEDESQTSFGASKPVDFTWKDLLDSEACIQCSRCQNLCPAWNTDKPLSPMKVIQDLNAQAHEDATGDLISRIGKDALWACTTCRACQSNCPAEVEHVPKIIEMRRNLVLMEGEFPGPEVAKAMQQLETNGNPLGAAPAGRADWTSPVADLLSPMDQAEVLYFVGCYASFDKRNQKIAQNLVRLCHSAGVKVGILGNREKCCGEPARKLGNEYLYQTLAQENISSIQASGAKQVVTACPHCFDTLSKAYPDLGLSLPVEHYSTYLNKLVQQGRLKLHHQAASVTLHDSCYLTRYNNICKSPRNLLFEAGIQVREMAQVRRESFCCGGGGGRILAEEKIGSRINQTRVLQARETGAEVLASLCPFCLTMFEDGIKGAGLEGQMTPKDLTELLIERLHPQGDPA